MSGMADGYPVGGLWNWCAAGRVDAAEIRTAIAGALGRPVVGLDADTADDALLCDIWYVGGDFPTLIDCYLAPNLGFSAPTERPGAAGGTGPAEIAEATIASAVAVRLDVAILLPDDTLNPTRYVLAEPDGTLRTVHVDEMETDDGTERRHLRPCTGADPACAAAPERNAA